jgi:hypothetical protein
MERSIIGYKVPYDLYKGNLIAGDIIKPYCKNFKDYESVWYKTKPGNETFNLPKEIVERWEPVYEEIKVNDFITTIKTGGNATRSKYWVNSYYKTGLTFKIKDIEESDCGKLAVCENGYVIYLEGEYVRLSTPEEIEEATTIKIGYYKAKFHNIRVSFNNVEYNRVDLCILRDLMNKGQIKSLNVGCSGQYKVDLELINKIISQF